MFKKSILFIHRWLGFISGLVVLTVSLTGCIFVFQDEIRDLIEPWRKVEVKNQSYLTPSTLQQKALAIHPKGTIARIVYTAKNRSAAVLINENDQLSYSFFNPYTGEFLHHQNLNQDFFIIIQYLHMYLLLPPEVGGMIVGVSVLIFVIMMITGIILWWPKRKTDRKRSFKIKWNGRWRRVNYDLHNVLGFYTFSLALIVAITGLSMSFEWVKKGIYVTSNLGKSYEEELKPVNVDTLSYITSQIPASDKAFEIARSNANTAEMFLLSFPAKKGSPLNITAYAKSLHYYKSDKYSFDPVSGVLVNTLKHADKSPGLKMNSMNYDLHTGLILGISGKIIAFFTSLICASLPVTGFIIWLGRKKNKAKTSNSLQSCKRRRIKYRVQLSRPR